jgi:hypothetical protein
VQFCWIPVTREGMGGGLTIAELEGRCQRTNFSRGSLCRLTTALDAPVTMGCGDACPLVLTKQRLAAIMHHPAPRMDRASGPTGRNPLLRQGGPAMMVYPSNR